MSRWTKVFTGGLHPPHDVPSEDPVTSEPLLSILGATEQLLFVSEVDSAPLGVVGTACLPSVTL